MKLRLNLRKTHPKKLGGSCCDNKENPQKGSPKASDRPSGPFVASRTFSDLLVVGGGSAGFAAALRAHELGARVVMINEGVMGGTCVNVGCVPSKTLIRAAESHYRASHNPFRGIRSTSEVTDFGSIIRQKDELIASLRKAKYQEVLASYPNIQWVEGRAVFQEKDTLLVNGKLFKAPKVIIATGGYPWIPPIPGLKEAHPLTSTTLFELSHLPKSLIVLGGRYIALECAQMMARFGTKVTILQRSSHLLPLEDEDITEALADYLKAEGIEVVTSAKVQGVKSHHGRIMVEALVEGKKAQFEGDKILCATGRRPNTQGMALDKVGVKLAEDGRMGVNDYLESHIPGIYGAGDVIGEPAFVYTAAYEGQVAAENALQGNTTKRDYHALPWVIFTDPQVSGVGLNEKEAEKAGIEIEVARLPLDQVPRAQAARDTRGLIKLIKEKGRDDLLGARILAPEGGEQIMEVALAIRYRIGVSELASLFHPYLTQGEGIKLCAQTFQKDVQKLSCCAS